MAYAATFPGAVEVLRGAADRLIGWGRTLLVTVASSYANRASPPATGRTMLDTALRAPMDFRICSRTFWFFLMVLAERPSRPWASQSSV